MYSIRVLRATVSRVDHGREGCSAAANESAQLHDIAGEVVKAVSFEVYVRVGHDLITELRRNDWKKLCVEEAAR